MQVDPSSSKTTSQSIENNENVDEEMKSDKSASPEIQIIPTNGSKSPPPPSRPRERSPFTGGYAEQFKRKATPIHVSPEVQVSHHLIG